MCRSRPQITSCLFFSAYCIQYCNCGEQTSLLICPSDYWPCGEDDGLSHHSKHLESILPPLWTHLLDENAVFVTAEQSSLFEISTKYLYTILTFLRHLLWLSAHAVIPDGSNCNCPLVLPQHAKMSPW